MKLIFSLTFTLMTGIVAAQQIPPVNTLMKGKDFIGAWPEDVSYSALGDSIFYKTKNETDKLAQWWALVDNQNIKIQDNSQARFADRIDHPVEEIFLWVKNHAVYQGNYKKNSLKLLFENPQKIKNVSWIGTSNAFQFTIKDNNFVYDAQHQINFFAEWQEKQKEKNISEEKWFEEQQNMFKVLNHRKDKLRAEKRKQNQKSAALSIKYEMRKGRWKNMVIDNERQSIWAVRSKGIYKSTVYMDYVTDDGFAQKKRARSKVGTYFKKESLYAYNIEEDNLKEIDFSKFPGMYQQPEYLDKDQKREKPKKVVIHGPVFSPFSNWAWVELRSTDNKDRWIALVHPEKNVRLVDHQHDEAWIGGPGITGWNNVPGNIGWMDDGKKLWFQSEKTGYSHLYSYDLQSKKVNQMTSGPFEIRLADYSRKKDLFYITANKADPGVRNFYHFNWKKQKWTGILESQAGFLVEVSPDEESLSGRFSQSKEPWEIFTAKNKKNASPKTQTHSTRPQFDSISWQAPQVMRFRASDGKKVPARVYRPENPNGAAVIFVHGAGYLQNAHHWWSAYYREYLFNQKLRSEGYTVLDIDYRASDGYGRDWRTSIYRQMGGPDLSDQIDGRQFLIDSLSIDPERIGIYGGSYGGFITLMALLKEPGKFQSGAAIRSVTDWAHYNHPYTSNILNTPTKDSMAYVKSSPIYFADGLEDDLLMLHGVLDNNVQYQDILRLSQRFIELGKEDWSLMSYPLEPHSFRHPTSWQDEYRRIHELFERTLR